MDFIINILKIIGRYPAALVISAGLLVILMAIYFPLGVKVQLVFGWLGFFTLIAGIIVHIIWIQS